jgi:DNA end-binding protein Ku
MRDRQHLGLLRVRDGVITLEQLYFADEIRPTTEIAPTKSKVDKRELEMASTLIDSFAGAWEPEKYKDTYRDELLAVVEAKRKGRDVHEAAEAEEEEAPTDLMTALRESIERSRTGRRPPVRDRQLERLSKEELVERARRANLPGRSKMSKDELVAALRRAA